MADKRYVLGASLAAKVKEMASAPPKPRPSLGGGPVFQELPRAGFWARLTSESSGVYAWTRVVMSGGAWSADELTGSNAHPSNAATGIKVGSGDGEVVWMWAEEYFDGDIHYSFFYPRTVDKTVVTGVGACSDGTMSVTYETIRVLDQAEGDS